jgi:hypothetical protein
MSLPKPSGTYGYTDQDIAEICSIYDITEEQFGVAFGCGNTCAIDEQGRTNYYVCDVERALYNLGHPEGRFHVWD